MLARERITKAITKACSDWPRIASLVVRLSVREKPGIETIAIDPAYRLYYCPEYVDQLTIEQIAYVIKCEILHPILKHHARSQRAMEWHDTHKKQRLELLNLAADCVVEDIMDSERQDNSYDSAKGRYQEITGNYANDLCLEQYYLQLLDATEILGQEEDQTPDPKGNNRGPRGGLPGLTPGLPDGSGSGSGSNPQDEQPDKQEPDLSKRQGGSGADGEPREWDDPYEAPTLTSDPSDDSLMDSTVEAQANKFLEGCKGKSSEINRAFLRTNKEKKVQCSPASLLRSVISRTAGKIVRGLEVQTYKRRSRRQQQSEIIRKGWGKPVPKVCVVIDTSGSMGDADVSYAVNVVNKVIKDMRLDSARVVCGDMYIRSDQSRVRRGSEVTLYGNGGTQMDYICQQIMKEPKATRPEVIVLVTDGETDWPKRTEVPVVALLTRCGYDNIPDHIKWALCSRN